MIKDVKGPRLDKYGNRIIEKRGEKNLYAEIQSYKDDCDINMILTRYMMGDQTVLSVKAAQFMDITQIPDNMSDLFNMTVAAKDLFKTLPTEVREKFGNNVYNFVANIGTEAWNEVMNVSEEDLRKDKVKASKENRDLNQKLVNAIRKENIEEFKPPIENPGIDQPVEPQTSDIKRGLNSL